MNKISSGCVYIFMMNALDVVVLRLYKHILVCSVRVDGKKNASNYCDHTELVIAKS